jgi:hypothetical protein
MVDNIIQHSNNTPQANNPIVTEYRSNSGVGIIRWKLPDLHELTRLTSTTISAEDVERLHQQLQKIFLARNFIDLDLFVMPDEPTWLSAPDADPYELPKGRSKVRIDDDGGSKTLVCQWHLPSHLVEYFNAGEGMSFDSCWDRNQIIEVITDYIG